MLFSVPSALEVLRVLVGAVEQHLASVAGDGLRLVLLRLRPLGVAAWLAEDRAATHGNGLAFSFHPPQPGRARGPLAALGSLA